MGILTSNMPTLLDKFSRSDSTGKIAKIVELMAKQNDILMDAEYQECNDGSKHKTTMRSGIPEQPGACSTMASSLPSPPLFRCSTPQA